MKNKKRMKHKSNRVKAFLMKIVHHTHPNKFEFTRHFSFLHVAVYLAL